MSLIAQMQRDRQSGDAASNNGELPLFAAAEAIAAGKRRRAPLLLLPAIFVPLLLIATPVWMSKHFADQAAALPWQDIPGSPTQPRVSVTRPMQVSEITAPATAEQAEMERQAVELKTAGPQGNAAAQQSIGSTPGHSRAELTVAAVDRPARTADAPAAAEQRTGAGVPEVAATVTGEPAEAARPQRRQRVVEVAAKLHTDRPLRQTSPQLASEHGRLNDADTANPGIAQNPHGFKRVSALSAARRDQILLGKASDLIAVGAKAAAGNALALEVFDSTDYPQSAALLASLLTERRDFLRAASLLDLYTAAHPGHEKIVAAGLRLAVAQGEFDLALQTIGTLSPELQDRVEIIELRALASHSLEDYASASYFYGQLLRRDDTNARWWMGLAVAFDANAQFANAREAYTRALETRGLAANLHQYARQRLAQL